LIFRLKLNKILIDIRKGKDITMKKTVLLTVIVLVLTSPFSAHADDVLDKLNSIEIAISKLAKKIDALEKRLAAIENVLLVAPKTKAPAKPKAKPRPRDATSIGPEDFVSIGGGFLLGNLRYKASLGDTIFNGEIENQSIKNYKTVIFNIQVFDKKETILGGSDFYLQELYMGAKVPFEVTIFGVNKDLIAGYEINFVRGF
jgi:hypothetical protein